MTFGTFGHSKVHIPTVKIKTIAKSERQTIHIAE